MFEDKIFAAIADGTLLDPLTSFYLRQSIPGSITVRDTLGHNYLEVALRISLERKTAFLSEHRRGSRQNPDEQRRKGETETLYETSQAIVNHLLREHPALLNQQDASGMTPLMRFSAGLILLRSFMSFQKAYRPSHQDSAEVVSLLCQHGVTGALQDNQGKTALHHAAEKGIKEVVARLCEAFPSLVNVQESQGLAALHLAAQNKTANRDTHKAMFTTLVVAGANVTLADKTGGLPLHHYVFVNTLDAHEGIKPHESAHRSPVSTAFIETVVTLCDASYSVLAREDNQGQTALHLAFNQLTSESSQAARGNFLALCRLYCQQGHASVVMSLATQSKGDLFVYLFDYLFKNEVLNIAAVSTSSETRQDSTSEAYPLSYLIDILQALAKLDSDGLSSLLSNQVDAQGQKLIHHIIQKGTMQLLHQYGGKSLDLSAADKSGNTPLHLLIEKEAKNQNDRMRRFELIEIIPLIDHECFVYLCEQGAKIDLPNQIDATPLHLAVKYKDLPCIQTLLKHGANPNIQDKNGATSLHLAVFHGTLSYTQRLLNHGALVSIQNQAGRTPIHVDIRARQRSSTKPVAQRSLGYLALLLRHASDETICLRDKDGRTALHEAIRVSDVGAVICLLARCPQLLNIEDNMGRTPLALAQTQRDALLAESAPSEDLLGDELLNKHKVDSEKILRYLEHMANANIAETSSCSAAVVNAWVKTYAHKQDTIFLGELSTLKQTLWRHKPSRPGFHLNPDYRPTQADYNKYDRRSKQHNIYEAALQQAEAGFLANLQELAQIDNHNAYEVIREQTNAGFLTHLCELTQRDHSSASHVQASSCAVAETMSSAVPSSSSSSMTPEPSSPLAVPEPSSSVPSDSVLPMGVKGSLSVTFMPPSPPSSSSSQPSSSQPSYSQDVYRPL